MSHLSESFEWPASKGCSCSTAPARTGYFEANRARSVLCLPIASLEHVAQQAPSLSRSPGLQTQLVYNEGRMSVTSPVYLDIIDFIAAGTTPEAVADFRPSPEAQQRLATLIEIEKEGSLSPEEKAELDHFMDLEHILRMARARARQILSRGE